MSSGQPYLYNTPQGEFAFNPKAVTIASRQAPPPPKPKPEGPLVNFNKHPDSYLVVPYGNTNAKPMNPRVKKAIKIVRWIQLFLRVLNLLGAVGAVLCGIFIKGAQETEGYIMRIPPGVDIVVALYAIYHLLRSAKSRPAGSSASYHFFALVTDAGFIPFYVFIALLTRRTLNLEVGESGRWRTLFPTDEETDKILQTEWLIGTTVAGLHCASLVLDLYLVLVFRQISRLPPDMNPLEDNLTSRRKTKHKHKNSSISAITPLTQEEKRFSVQTTSTAGTRDSQAAPLIGNNNIPTPDGKAMAFMHTRTNSDMAYSPHTPNSARQSRERFSTYSQPASTRQSRADLNRREDLLHRDDDGEETLAQRKSLLAQQAIKRSSRPNSFVTSASKENFYTPPTTASKQDLSGDIGDISQQNSRESLQSDNWFVYENSDELEDGHYAAPKPALFSSQKQRYNTVSTYDDVSDEEYGTPLMPQPLRMNPPTPPPAKAFKEANDGHRPSALKRTQTTTSLSSEATFTRSLTSASAKSRYYGDLKAAKHGVRTKSPANSPNASPTRSTHASILPSSAKQYARNTPPVSPVKSMPFSLDKKSYTSVRKTGEAGYTPATGQSPRVVSRSGVDYSGPYQNDDSDLGTPGRRRDVSGKVAEEGRGGVAGLAERWGGMKNHGLTHRKVSGVA